MNTSSQIRYNLCDLLPVTPRACLGTRLTNGEEREYSVHDMLGKLARIRPPSTVKMGGSIPSDKSP